MVGQVRISVAMVAYNGEKYIREQLDSILGQLTERDEVMISDDGSTDRTPEILKSYQQKDSRVKVIRGPGKGVKKNVEHVLSQCRGTYIFLADQDDIWLPHKTERVLEIFKARDCSLVIHDAKVFQQVPEEIFMESFLDFRKGKAGILKNIWKNSYIGCCMAFKQELVKKVVPIPENIEMHDQWIGILNDLYLKKSYFLREPLLLYRRHGDNTSGMKHYGLGKMLRNRIIFCVNLLGRIIHIC